MEPEQKLEYDNLRKAEKLWEKALKGVNGQNNSGIKYSTIYNGDGTFNRVKIEDNILENRNGKSIEKTIAEYLKQHINEYAYIIESGQKVYLEKDLPNEYSRSKSMGTLPVSARYAKGRAVTELKEIINNAKNKTWEKNKKAKHNVDAKYGFYRYVTKFSFEHNGKEQIYTGNILIRNDENGKKYLYDILGVKKIGINQLPLASNPKKSSAIVGSPSSLPNKSDNLSGRISSSTSQNIASKGSIHNKITLSTLIWQLLKNFSILIMCIFCFYKIFKSSFLWVKNF